MRYGCTGCTYKVVPKKGHQLNKKVTNFWKLVTFFSKLVTFFWVHMMGTTGTTRGVRVYPAISWKCTSRTLKSVPTVPRKVYQPYPEKRTNRTQQYRSHPMKYPPWRTCPGISSSSLLLNLDNFNRDFLEYSPTQTTNTHHNTSTHHHWWFGRKINWTWTARCLGLGITLVNYQLQIEVQFLHSLIIYHIIYI